MPNPNSQPSPNSHPRSARALLGATGAALLLTAACGIGGEGKEAYDPAVGLNVSELSEPDEYAPDLMVDQLALGVTDYKEAKFIKVDTQNGTAEFAPLAELKLDDDELRLHDLTEAGMGLEVLEWWGERFMANKPLIEEAFKTGSLKAIRIGLDNDGSEYPEISQSLEQGARDMGFVFGHFNDKDQTLIFEISQHARFLNAEVMDQYVAHEAIHALFADGPVSSFSDDEPGRKLAENFRQACVDLRGQATEDLLHRTISVELALQKLVSAETDPAGKLRYQTLLDGIKAGRLAELEPTANYPLLDWEKVQECAVVTLGTLQSGLGDKLNLPKPQLKDWENMTETERAETSEVNTAYSEAQEAMDKLFVETSLYQVLTEGNYEYEAPSMGHPHDNIDELVASTVNLMISYPEDMALKVRHLPEEQKTAVVAVMRTSIDALAKAHPDIQGYLSDVEAQMLKLIRE